MLDRWRIWLALVGAAAGVAALVVASSRRATPPNPVDAKVPVALAAAAAYLERAQSEDGSWPSFLSERPDFRDAKEQTRVYPATNVIRSLEASAYARAPWIERARHYVETSMEAGHVWSVDGKQHDLSYRFARLSCFVAPDTETTAVALLTLQHRSPPSREALSALLARYATLEHDSGLYRSYWLDFYGERGCPADYGNRPSLGSNLNVLTFMLSYRLPPADALRRAIFAYLNSAQYPAGLVYFRSPAVLAQFASHALELDRSTGLALTKRFLADFEKSGALVDPRKPNALHLGAYVHARCAVRHAEREPCDDLRPWVAELLKRQAKSGAWPAGDLYEAGLNDDGTGTKHYYGSSAETTAAVMQALVTYSSAPP